MKPLRIAKTNDSPLVNFNQEEKIFEISGVLIPEDPAKFYKPIIAWTNEYSKDPDPETNIVLKIEYINTSSSKSLIQVLRIFEKLNQADSNVHIQWFWEDEDMFEAGSDYKSVLQIPFEIIRVDHF